ncbi:hypothetical protein KCU99_g318, partial [Aureobasidium melanogenum]
MHGPAGDKKAPAPSDRGDNRCLQNVGRTGSPELRPCAQGRRLDCSPSPTLQKGIKGDRDSLTNQVLHLTN